MGFEVWSQYPEDEFHGADDRMWEEDEWTAQVRGYIEGWWIVGVGGREGG